MSDFQACPFGPELQKYWDKRYELFSKFDEGILVDKEALYSIEPEKTAHEHAKMIAGKVVLDAFGCVGGSVIAFARHCPKVFMIELDGARLEMAKNNAKIYGVERRIEFIQGDYFKIAPSIKADVIFLDPPWGGPSYSQLDKFTLDNFSPNGKKILELAFKHFPEVIIRLPRNFDLEELKVFSRHYKLTDDYLNDRLITKTAYFY